MLTTRTRELTLLLHKLTAFQQKKRQSWLNIFTQKCKETDVKFTAADCSLNITTGYAQ